MNRWIAQAVCLIIAAGFNACGGSSDQGQTNNTAAYLAIPANGIFTDSLDNVSIDFVDIIGAALTVDSAEIIFELTLRNLPASLTFNQTNVPLNALEYQWAVEFDIDNDDVADYSMSASHFKSSNNQIVGSIANITQNDVWKHNAATGVVSHLVSAQASLTGNTIRLGVAKSAHPDLVNITSSAKVRIKTYYRIDGTTFFRDSI